MDINEQATQAIKALLEDKRMSRTALAEKSAIPYSTLNRKLNGGGELGLTEVGRIAKALDVPASQIIPVALLTSKAAA